jgi:uncharacterized repeat protein (TIGR01451 family)
MQRKIILVAVAVLSALGLAAFVRGQQSNRNHAPPAVSDDDDASAEPTTLTDRLRDIRRQVIGDAGTTQSQPRSSPPIVQGDDWSAGRKMGAPTRSAETSSRRTARQDAASEPADENPPTQSRTAWGQSGGRPSTTNPSPQQNPFVGQPRTQSPAAIRSQANTAPRSQNSPAARSQSSPHSQAQTRSQAQTGSQAPAWEQSGPPAPAANPQNSSALHARLKALRSAQQSNEAGSPSTSPATAPEASVASPGPLTDSSTLPIDATPVENRIVTTDPSSEQANRPAELQAPQSPAATPRTARRSSNSDFRDSPRTASRTPSSAEGALVATKSPVLQVKTTGPQKIVIGKSGSYQVVVENAGDVAANEVVLTVKLPAWAELESAKPSAGKTDKAVHDQAGETLQWSLSRLEAHSQETLSLAIVPRQSKPFQVAVSWTFVPDAFQALVDVLEPKLAIAMAAPDEMLYGQSEAVKITLTNPGTGNAENVVLTIASNQPGQDAPDRRVLGVLPAGESKVIELRLAGSHAGSVSLAATVTGDGGLSAESSARILVRRAGLKIEALAPRAKYAGTPTTCKLKVSNPGNAPASHVRVEVVLPAGAKFLAASGGGKAGEDHAKVTWTLASLDAGAEQVLDVRYALSTAGENRLHVLATAEGKLSDSTTATTRVEALADLKIEVTDPQGPTPIHEEVVYEVRLRNRGTKAAEKVAVVGYFTDGIEPIKVAGAVATLEPGQVTCHPIAALAAGDETTIKITARASAPGNHVFRAEVTCQHPETRLVAEETTTFYGEGTVDGADATPTQAAAATPARPDRSSQRPITPQGENSVKKPATGPQKPGDEEPVELMPIRVSSPKRVPPAKTGE